MAHLDRAVTCILDFQEETLPVDVELDTFFPAYNGPGEI
jgi:hypothetical protein